MADHNNLGNKGERIAADFLRNKAYSILHTNWRNGKYELDIVARKDGELVVVEVKTRSHNSLISPESAVDRQKILHIVAAADKYVRLFNIDMPVRFDIIAIAGEKIEHIEDAFYPPAMFHR
ncbi:MAG: YraN family protein [Dysgonamonadaceae bacterium]|jgi:putative endonuclease|nr:YraN family protein [Dysgonamonadaceae bacterium]